MDQKIEPAPFALQRGEGGVEFVVLLDIAGKIPPFNSTKSLAGHSLGATGAQEAIFSLLQMQNGFIAESANIEEIDPEIGDAPVVRARIDNARLERVLSNSFGFGGTNATLVFQRCDA